MVGLMKSVAEETRNSGIVVTGILPGSVDTEMLKGSGFAAQMSPADVAREIVHLATTAAPALHGSAVEMFG
jgi:3-oxoacyl-[acyl-carrier protein] reductase